MGVFGGFLEREREREREFKEFLLFESVYAFLLLLLLRYLWYLW